MSSAAQEEFDRLVANSVPRVTSHPEDNHHPEGGSNSDDELAQELTEEEVFRNAQIEATMRMPVGASTFTLPPRSFDSGHATGVKGVIADARHYQSARRRNQVGRGRGGPRTATAIRNGGGGGAIHSGSEAESDAADSENDDDEEEEEERRRREEGEEGEEAEDDEEEEDGIARGGHLGRGKGKGSDEDEDEEREEEFLQQWRETRRRELESDTGRTVRTRRTSPSVRVYGRLDRVDALGYLDAIEIVGRGTTVIVFVYDHECEVSATIEVAIQPLVKKYPNAHFVMVHYDEMEFDNAAVPAILAYRNQGDLVANLTGLIEMMPDEDYFGPDELEHLLRAHAVL